MHDARVRSLCPFLSLSLRTQSERDEIERGERENKRTGKNERVSRLTLCWERGRLQQAASNLSKEGTGPTGVELDGTTLESFGDSGATKTAKARIAAAAGGLCEGIEVGTEEKEKTAEREEGEVELACRRGRCATTARSEMRSDGSRRDEDVARSRRIYDRGEVAARLRRRHGKRRA